MIFSQSNSPLTTSVALSGNGTLKKSKHKKTKSVSGPEIFDIPKEETNHRRTKSSVRSSTNNSSNGSLGLQQAKQKLFNQTFNVDYSSSTLNNQNNFSEDNEYLRTDSEVYSPTSNVDSNSFITTTAATTDNESVINEEYEGKKTNSNSSENEWIIQALCEIENGLKIVLDRVKQNLNSCKDAVVFLKKRAIIEEEYGKSMIKLCQTMLDSNGKDKNESKQGLIYLILF